MRCNPAKKHMQDEHPWLPLSGGSSARKTARWASKVTLPSGQSYPRKARMAQAESKIRTSPPLILPRQSGQRPDRGFSNWKFENHAWTREVDRLRSRRDGGRDTAQIGIFSVGAATGRPPAKILRVLPTGTTPQSPAATAPLTRGAMGCPANKADLCGLFRRAEPPLASL